MAAKNIKNIKLDNELIVILSIKCDVSIAIKLPKGHNLIVTEDIDIPHGTKFRVKTTICDQVFYCDSQYWDRLSFRPLRGEFNPPKHLSEMQVARLVERLNSGEDTTTLPNFSPFKEVFSLDDKYSKFKELN